MDRESAYALSTLCFLLVASAFGLMMYADGRQVTGGVLAVIGPLAMGIGMFVRAHKPEQEDDA